MGERGSSLEGSPAGGFAGGPIVVFIGATIAGEDEGGGRGVTPGGLAGGASGGRALQSPNSVASDKPKSQPTAFASSFAITS